MKIFIIHKGRQEYLKITIKQILKYNDWNDVIFLTDNKLATKKFLWENIVYENISDYFDSAKEFEIYYKHMSYNKKQYELFCFQRWLILNEYITRNKIKEFSHIDSDVLLYCNVQEYYNDNLKWLDFCYTWSCWHVFFGSQRWINCFSEFLFDQYKNNLEELKKYCTGEKISRIIRNNGSIYEDKTNCVTDMTLFDLFIKNSSLSIQTKDIWIIQNNTVFDNCIHMSEWFKYRFWIKNLKFDWELPYWILKGDKRNNKIYFKALHFQWVTKKFMKYFYEKDFWLRYKKDFFSFWIKKTVFNVLEAIFKMLKIYEPMRNLYLKYIRKWINPIQ